MTPKLITCLSAVAAVGFLAACTNTPTRPTARYDASQYDATKKRVYTQEQMLKTGEPTTAAALEKLDPSVTVSGSR